MYQYDLFGYYSYNLELYRHFSNAHCFILLARNAVQTIPKSNYKVPSRLTFLLVVNSGIRAAPIGVTLTCPNAVADSCG